MKRALLTVALLATTTLSAQVDTLSIKKDIEILASDEFEGRRAATKGDTLAREYLIKRYSQIKGVKLLGDGGLHYGAGMSAEVSATYDRSKRSEYKNNTITVTSLENLPTDVKGKSVMIDSVLLYKEGYAKIRCAVEALKSDSAAVVRFPMPICNVVAKIEAPKKNNKDGKAVIIGAHYDHEGIKPYKGKMAIHPGADDNASGTSYVLDLARQISLRADELEQDVIFINFGGEERGLLGSAAYANNPLEPLENATLMINFDMLGRMRDKGITVRGLGTFKEAVSLMNSLENKDKLDIIWEFRGNGPTDYSSFYMLADVPALSFSTRLHSDYHLPMDSADKVNYEGVKMAADYIWQLVEKSVFNDNSYKLIDMY